MFSLTLDEQLIKVQFKRDRRLRGFKLAYVNDCLVVRGPYRLSRAKVHQLIVNHRGTVLKLINDTKCIIREESKRYQNEARVFFRGNLLTLNIVTSRQLELIICNTRDELIIEIPERLGTQDIALIVKQALMEWYLRQSQVHFKLRLEYWAQQIGVEYHSVRLKRLKSRWGSCSSKGNINLNWLLIMAPDWIIDYVIVHELCHLRYMDHSKQFWSLVKQYSPEYIDARNWLRLNGSSLCF